MTVHKFTVQGIEFRLHCDPVATWCRKCGNPAIIQNATDFEATEDTVEFVVVCNCGHVLKATAEIRKAE